MQAELELATPLIFTIYSYKLYYNVHAEGTIYCETSGNKY